MLALGKDKNSRAANPQTPNHTECTPHPVPLQGCICSDHGSQLPKGKETQEKRFIYRAGDKQVTFHLRINWRPASPLDIVMLKMERERNSRVKP